MAKVDWISWRTDPSEIVNPSRIEKKILDCFQNYHVYMKNFVSEEIRNDTFVGGLSKESYIVSGSSPLYSKAEEILNQIEELDGEIQTFQKELRRALEEQKSYEKERLIQAISNKIVESEDDLQRAMEGRIVENDILLVGMSRDDFIFSLKEQIEKLNEKLEVAKSL